MQDSTMNPNVEALLEHLYRSGTGDDKLAKIKAIVAGNPTFGVSGLIEAMSEAGLPAGTIAKCRAWCDDPSLTLPPRVRKSVGDMLVASAVDYNRKREVFDVESS